MPNTTIRLGTDFSGIDAPWAALKPLAKKWGVNAANEFASEIVPHLRARLTARHVADDITTRDHAALPRTTLYVAGFPCQPFSTKGKHSGRGDARGRLVDHSLAYVARNKPNVVVLENVRGFLRRQHHRTLRHVVEHLRTSGYRVYLFDVNAQDVGMVQSRPRIWIVAIRKTLRGAENFRWVPNVREHRQTLAGIRNKPGPLTCDIPKRGPKGIKRMTHLLWILHEKARKKGYRRGDLAIYDLGTGPGSFAYVAPPGTAPCITRNSSPSLAWVKVGTPWVRFLRRGDLLELQGFPRNYGGIKGFSRTQVANAAGNTMSVPVLRSLFKALRPFLVR